MRISSQSKTLYKILAKFWTLRIWQKKTKKERCHFGVCCPPFLKVDHVGVLPLPEISRKQKKNLVGKKRKLGRSLTYMALFPQKKHLELEPAVRFPPFDH